MVLKFSHQPYLEFFLLSIRRAVMDQLKEFIQFVTADVDKTFVIGGIILILFSLFLLRGQLR